MDEQAGLTYTMKKVHYLCRKARLTMEEIYPYFVERPEDEDLLDAIKPPNPFLAMKWGYLKGSGTFVAQYWDDPEGIKEDKELYSMDGEELVIEDLPRSFKEFHRVINELCGIEMDDD